MVTVALPRLKMCKDCSEVAVSTDGRCGKHSTRAREVKNYTARPNPTKAMKNPFGMEIECIAGDKRRDVVTVASHVCSDGSLGYDGVEIKLVADAPKMGDKAADIAQRAKIAGATVSRRCGLHVHMSLPVNKDAYIPRYSRSHQEYKALTSTDRDNLFPYIKGMEDEMYNLIPSSRRDNTYCQRIRRSSELANHYSWLSLSCRVPTIELRLHPGTLNPWKVKAWSEFCIVMQEALHSIIEGKPNRQAEYMRAGTFTGSFPYSSLAGKYIRARKNADGKLLKFGF